MLLTIHYFTLQAEKTCEDQWNAELTAITSAAEQTIINDMRLKVNKDIWIGLSDVVSNSAEIIIIPHLLFGNDIPTLIYFDILFVVIATISTYYELLE